MKPNESLSKREAQILEMVSLGKRNKDIACKLEISESTVAFHIYEAISKLKALNRVHAVRIWVTRKHSFASNGTRQAKYIARIRAERRKAKLCVECSKPSKSYRCETCRPKKSAKSISKARANAARARWKK